MVLTVRTRGNGKESGILEKKYRGCAEKRRYLSLMEKSLTDLSGGDAKSLKHTSQQGVFCYIEMLEVTSTGILYTRQVVNLHKRNKTVKARSVVTLRKGNWTGSNRS